LIIKEKWGNYFKMVDGRTRQERIKKWIRDQREFGKKFNIEKQATARNIKMSLLGYENIAGLDKRGLKSMGYKNSKKLKIRKYSPKRDNFFEVWKLK